MKLSTDVFIRLTNIKHPDKWAIYHKLNTSEHTLMMGSDSHWKRNWSCNDYTPIRVTYNIQLLTKEEVDLLILELL